MNANNWTLMKMQHKLKNNDSLQFISLPLWQHHRGWDVRLTWSSSGFSSRAKVLGTQDPQFSLPQWLKSQVFLQMWNPIENPEAFNTEDSIHLQGGERNIICFLETSIPQAAFLDLSKQHLWRLRLYPSTGPLQLQCYTTVAHKWFFPLQYHHLRKFRRTMD